MRVPGLASKLDALHRHEKTGSNSPVAPREIGETTSKRAAL